MGSLFKYLYHHLLSTTTTAIKLCPICYIKVKNLISCFFSVALRSSSSSSSSSSSLSLLHYLFVFRCYACDDEVPVEPETPVHNCIKLILKAMNLSPPPGLYITDKIDQILNITLNLYKNTYLGNSHLYVIRQGIEQLGGSFMYFLFQYVP